MRIAVLNFAAHVGKSVLARHLLLPRIPDSELLQIDPYRPFNSGSTFDAVCTVLASRNLVVDVPYWQTRWLFRTFHDYSGLHKEYDYFVVPTTAESVLTVQRTIATIARLNEIGVPAKKIRPIFNAVDRGTNMSRAFSEFYRYWKDEKSFELNATAVIHRSQVFRQFYGLDLTFAQLIGAPAGLLRNVMAIDAIDDNYSWRQLVAAKRLLPGVLAELDAVFRTVFD